MTAEKLTDNTAAIGLAGPVPTPSSLAALDARLARLSQTDCQIAHSDPFFTRDGESTS